MAAIVGHQGSCTAGGNTVGTAKAWSMNLASDTIETTTFADGGWKANTQTLKNWSGDITVVFDGGEDTGEASLISSITDGSSVALELLTGATGTGSAEKFSGSANVTGMPIKNEVAGVIEVSFSFQGTGALPIAALA